MGKFGDFLKSDSAAPVLGAGLGVLQTGLGILQRGAGYRQAKKALKDLGPNQGILDYYEQAKQRYGVSPTESALYKRQQQNIGRNVATGLGALQREGNVLGGVSSLVRGASDAALNAEIAAEQQRAQRFGQLGSAAQMKASEELRPKQLAFQLAAQKAAGGTQLANVGMSNIYGAGQAYQTAKLYRDIYGVGNTVTPRIKTSKYSAGGLQNRVLPPNMSYGPELDYNPENY